MHPEIISDKPGKCPKCGMDLVLKDAPAQKEEGIKLDDLLQPTNNYVVSQLPVVHLKKENISTDNLSAISAIRAVSPPDILIPSINFNN